MILAHIEALPGNVDFDEVDQHVRVGRETHVLGGSAGECQIMPVDLSRVAVAHLHGY